MTDANTDKIAQTIRKRHMPTLAQEPQKGAIHFERDAFRILIN
jgi:hypothetical protein